MGWIKGKQQALKARKNEKADSPQPVDRPEDGTRPRGARARFSRWTQEQRDTMTARARASYMQRWRIMSGGLDHEIDYNNPQIELEFMLCDVDNIRLVYKGRHRDEFLAKLSPGAKDMYFTADPDGKTYAEYVEKPAFIRGLLRAMGVMIRGNDREIEKLLKELDEQNKAIDET